MAIIGGKLDTVGMGLGGVKEIVNPRVFNGYVAVDVEPVFAAMNVHSASGYVGVSERGPAGISARYLRVFND